MTLKVDYGHRAQPTLGMSVETPTSGAKRKVLEALEDIMKNDTSHEFKAVALRRYLDLTTPVQPANEPGQCDIVMKHTGINGPRPTGE